VFFILHSVRAMDAGAVRLTIELRTKAIQRAAESACKTAEQHTTNREQIAKSSSGQSPAASQAIIEVRFVMSASWWLKTVCQCQLQAYIYMLGKHCYYNTIRDTKTNIRRTTKRNNMGWFPPPHRTTPGRPYCTRASVPRL
jgi:hypothetical protein